MLCLSTNLFGQASLSEKITIQGTVSYQTGINTYVKFEQTRPIQIGDTLFNASNPCLLVQAKSSTSCVCVLINGCSLHIGDTLEYFYFDKIVVQQEEPTPSLSDTNSTIQSLPKDSIKINEPVTSGSLSFSTLAQQSLWSEANRTNLRQIIRFGVSHHFMFLGKPSILNLNGNYQHYYSNLPSNYPSAGRLNIFQGSIDQQLNSQLRLSVGRSFQANGLSTFGILDALRVQYSQNKWQFESLVGFLPHLGTFGIDLKQQLIGTSFVYAKSTQGKYLQFGFGTYLQLKNGLFDRFTTASQGVLNVGKLQGYFSSDIDLSAKSVRLNNLFVSSQWMISKKWQLFLSYDARQHFILWNSYNQSLIDDLLDNAVQQGLRVRIQYRAGANTILSLHVTNRFNKQLSQMQLLGLQIRQQKFFWRGAQLSYSGNLASYPSWFSVQQTLRFEQQIRSNQLGLYYRSQLFDRKEISTTIINQSTFGIQYNSALKKQLRFNLTSEFGMQQQQKIIRTYVTVIKKF
jgi:hypothetical protein